jgi:hypothetical protein
MRSFQAQDSLTTVLFGTKTLLEKGLYAINSQRLRRVIVLCSPDIADLPYVKDYYKVVEIAIVHIFEHVSIITLRTCYSVE